MKLALPPPSCCSGRVEGMRLAPVLAPRALWGACATAAMPPPPTEAALIREAFAKPMLDWCDELACHYRPPRYFNIRRLQCAPSDRRGKDPEAKTIECQYERSLLPDHWLMIPSLD